MGSTVITNGIEGDTSPFSSGGAGGAIYLSQGSITATNGSFDSNHAGAGYQSGGNGGGVNAASSVGIAVFDHLTFTNNRAGDGTQIGGSGGGLSVAYQPQITVTNSLFDGNQSGDRPDEGSSGDGGGLHFAALFNSTLIDGNTLVNNRCGVGGVSTQNSMGGGMFAASILSEVTFSNNQVSANSCDYGGGVAVFDSSGTDLNMQNEVISDNVAAKGGGLYLFLLQDTNLHNTIIQGNQANEGGGIWGQSTQQFTMTNALIAANLAITSGGGIDLITATNLLLVNSTVSDNYVSGGDGGGLAVEDSSARVINSIIWNNLDQAGIVTTTASISATNSAITITHSGVQASQMNDAWNNDIGVDGGNNLAGDPLFLSSTDPTTAPSSGGDYQLRYDSPAIDAGNPLSYTAVVSDAAADLAGQTRVVNALIDLGPYETQQYAFGLTLNDAALGSVESSIDGLACANGCSDTFFDGQPIVLTATVIPTGTFLGWSGTVSGNSNPVAITLTESTAVTATFAVTTYTLSTNTGGDGSGSIDRSPDAAAYPHGSLVTLSATADAGSQFDSWSGACSGADSCSVTMDSAKTVTATFALLAPELLSLELNEPPDEMIITTTVMLFEWEDLSGQGMPLSSYTLILTETVEGEDPVIHTFTSTENQYIVTLDLSAGDYSWQVDALDGLGDVIATSQIFEFELTYDLFNFFFPYLNEQEIVEES